MDVMTPTRVRALRRFIAPCPFNLGIINNITPAA